MSYSDEYDEFSELPDHQGPAALSAHERTVRRRSSKGELTCCFLLTSVYFKPLNPQPAINAASPSANVNALDPMNRVKVV